MRWMIILLTFFFANAAVGAEEPLAGAWESTSGQVKTVILIEDQYISITDYTPTAFVNARGGVVHLKGNLLEIRQEFNTAKKELITEKLPVSIQENTMTIGGVTFQRIDDGQAPLAGTWHITGRVQDGAMHQIHQTGTRKTLKMLTGTRFQWFAIDPDGNKFLGSGGGNYTFTNGTYTENIEFFSRDSTRVGAALSFDGKVEDGKWHHSGLSSKGQPINEVWERIE